MVGELVSPSGRVLLVSGWSMYMYKYMCTGVHVQVHVYRWVLVADLVLQSLQTDLVLTVHSVTLHEMDHTDRLHPI